MHKTIRTHRYCRDCGCVPCIGGTQCEGDLYPMDQVIVREMREVAFAKLNSKSSPVPFHLRVSAPRSPKPRLRKRQIK